MAEWHQLLSEVQKASEPEEVLRFLAPERLERYGEDTRWRVLMTALGVLREQGYPRYQELLLQYVLDRSELGLSDYEAHFLQDALTGWVRSQPPDVRTEVLGLLVGALSERKLSGPNWERVTAAIWAINDIGTRLEDATARLTGLAGLSGESDAPLRVQDAALAVLVFLAYPDTSALEKRLSLRLMMSEKPPAGILNAVRTLLSVNLLPQIASAYGTFAQDYEVFSSLIRALAETAEYYPSHAEEAWATILRSGNPGLVQELIGAGDVAQIVDLKSVPDVFLQHLQPSDPAQYHDASFSSPHYLPYRRLLDLSRPQQLQGIHHSSWRNAPRLWETLRLDACSDSNNPGFYQTSGSALKDDAWQVALRLNLPGVRSWLPEAMKDTSRSLKHDLSELAGFLKEDQSVLQLREWVGDPDTDIVVGVAALRALGQIGTADAYDAALHSALTLKEMGRPDDVPRDMVDALAACAVEASDADPIILRLESGATSDAAWLACAGALAQLAALQPTLLSRLHVRLSQLLCRHEWEARTGFAWLISAAGFLDKNIGAGGADIAARLRSWAGRSDPVGQHAQETLARWGELTSEPELMENIGIVRLGGTWRVSRILAYNEAFVLGLLYQQDPNSFISAVVDLLGQESYFVAAQLLQMLLHPALSNPGTEITEALLQRVHRVNSPSRVEADALETLVKIAPERFASEFSIDTCGEWYAPGREAIISCLRRASIANKRSIRQRQATLGAWLTDSVFAVRRAAARAFQELYPAELEREVRKLMQSEDVDHRAYATEATCWIEDDAKFKTLIRQAAADREAQVRRTVRFSRQRRQEQQWATLYVKQVIEVAGDDLLSAWSYAQALAEIGNDDTIAALRQAASDAMHPYHKRAWLLWIAESIQSKWEDKVRKNQER